MLGAKGDGVLEAIAGAILRGIGRAIGKELGSEYEIAIWLGLLAIPVVALGVLFFRARRRTNAHHKKSR